MPQQKETVSRLVTLKGIRPIMFDRYGGDNKTVLSLDQKLYLDMETGKRLVLPSANLMSFLCAENTKSAVKRFYKRGYSAVAQALLSFVSVEEFEVPFTANGKPIEFDNFKESGPLRIHHAVARLPKGIPVPKERPMLLPPWELSFTLTIYQNDEVNEVEVKNLFERGGLAIGLGNYRGVYGKFAVEKWQ